MTTTTEFDHLPCICGPQSRPDSYTVGCERHTAMAAAAPPVGYPMVETKTVTYYQATVKVCSPVMHNGECWSQESTVTCGHNHDSMEAAESCARRLATRTVGRSNVNTRRL